MRNNKLRLSFPTSAEIKSECDVSSNGCWEKRGINGNKYGCYRVNKKQYRAHRLSWLVHQGEISSGLYVCHKCNNKRCLNPEHLYLATHRQNCIDASTAGLLKRTSIKSLELRGITKINSLKKICVHGHGFTKENTYVYPDGKRCCKTCRRRSDRLRKPKLAELEKKP